MYIYLGLSLRFSVLHNGYVLIRKDNITGRDEIVYDTKSGYLPIALCNAIQYRNTYCPSYSIVVPDNSNVFLSKIDDKCLSGKNP